jgi:hypothetical protein
VSVRAFKINPKELTALVERDFLVSVSFGSALKLLLDLDTPEGVAQGEALLDIRSESGEDMYDDQLISLTREEVLEGLRAGKALVITRRDSPTLPIVEDLAAEGLVDIKFRQHDEQSSDMRVTLKKPPEDRGPFV